MFFFRTDTTTNVRLPLTLRWILERLAEVSPGGYQSGSNALIVLCSDFLDPFVWPWFKMGDYADTQ